MSLTGMICRGLVWQSGWTWWVQIDGLNCKLSFSLHFDTMIVIVDWIFQWLYNEMQKTLLLFCIFFINNSMIIGATLKRSLDNLQVCFTLDAIAFACMLLTCYCCVAKPFGIFKVFPHAEDYDENIAACPGFTWIRCARKGTVFFFCSGCFSLSLHAVHAAEDETSNIDWYVWFGHWSLEVRTSYLFLSMFLFLLSSRNGSHLHHSSIVPFWELFFTLNSILKQF